MSNVVKLRSRVIDLDEYDLCPHFGFVSCEGAVLPGLNDYYASWNHLLDGLADLLRSRLFRKNARALPLLSITKLQSSAEARRAYVCLAFFVQAWVFEDKDQPQAIVPPAISQPFVDICSYWGLQPVLSHSGYCLWNWRLNEDLDDVQVSPVKDEGRVELRALLLKNFDTFKSCGSFTGTDDEKIFSMVPILVETEGGLMVRLLLDAILEIEADAVASIVAILKTCLGCIEAMSRRLDLFRDRCDPQVFFHNIRPYLSGSKGMEEKGLPDGFVFQLANGKQMKAKCAGPSVAQSSLFQFVDQVFGVEHSSEFLKEMRSYMPRKHREFLELVESLPDLRQFVQAHSGHTELCEQFQACLEALRRWRTKHISMVTRYIMLPAKVESEHDGIKGTSGSLPLLFLKRTRDETVW